jgi:hypothetical protein
VLLCGLCSGHEEVSDLSTVREGHGQDVVGVKVRDGDADMHLVKILSILDEFGS